MTQHLLLMGPPGAGKGTQATLLAAWVPGAVHLEIGHLMRNAVRNDTPVGQRVKTYLQQGRLVPDPLVQAMVQQTLTTISSPLIIWDGFPRSLGQGQWLQNHLHQLQQQIVAVVWLEISPTRLHTRILNRLVCPACGYTTSRCGATTRCPRCQRPLTQRVDDNCERLRQRMAAYQTKTWPLRAYYQAAGLLHVVDATMPASRVTDCLKTLVPR